MRSFYITYFPLGKDWNQFLKESCDPEKWKECQILDNNQQHRDGSLVPGHIVGSNKYEAWKEGEQGDALCGNLLQLKCLLFLKMSVVEWASQKKSGGQDWPNNVGMGSSLLCSLC